MLELIRRAGLLAGFAVFLWLALESPSVILEVKRADFAAEYQHRYGKRSYPLMGAMEAGRELIRQTTDPGSVEAYAERATEKRLLAPGDGDWTRFHDALPPKPAFYAVDELPFGPRRADIEALHRRSHSSVLYLPAPGGSTLRYVEIGYRDRPRQTGAASSLVYPSRRRAWIWLAAALLCYLAIPWKSRQGAAVGYSRVVLIALDVLAALFTAFFFGLPLYVVHSTAAVLGEEFSMTVFLWAIAALGAVWVLWVARLAAFRIAVSPAALQWDGLLGTVELPFSRMACAGFTHRNGIRTGIYIRMHDGTTRTLDWAGLLHCETVLHAIAAAQVAPAEDREA
jgi:hypothetical protein